MQFLAYVLAYPFIWLISLLPFRVLYILSDFVYVLIYYIVGYRKKIVRKNFELCLPHLSAQEKKKVEKQFYHHFCDSFVEMVKTLNISDKEIKKRFVFTNFEVIHELEETGKSTVVLIGHYASYEWLLLMHKYLKKQVGFGIYKPIKNKYFDRLVRKIRGKFGAELIGMRQVIPQMRQNIRNGKQGAYGFITDQSPRLNTEAHWCTFFGMEVPVHVGGEMLSKKIGLNMAYARIEKVKRGYYQCTFIPVEGDLKAIPNFEVTDRFMLMLEEQIKQAPQYYLWTHNRFKHRKNDPVL
ncbi:lipid A biosynthesis acyltransferase [Flavobacterium akiainvivens]|uniref:Lipid A biosynthesis acyltransferase n=1 Tax=Flavobacterium akiainvivens TaxID=1202724 RepID=A0A0M8MGC5_9FLAO|nr:lipid A biosynthesis acyltransferase [Flavobacterium akiainvivens]KOS05187.1 lipid A biosynthesis acyltransferase [Flavobacterium akiainvivens]SFQ50775.1 KDO2-lipid IV(A) lauroyltransferase [Flavobacterium akiainvivens]